LNLLGQKNLKYYLTEKQDTAFEYLIDKETNEILYGGGAGGGKSVLGCVWLIYMCLAYPGTRYLMGRAILKTLKESTLLTFFKICKDIGLKKDIDFRYNAIEGVIRWNNESEIYLKDLFHYPSDPEFDELGSTEYTGAFIDEASQVSQKAYSIVMSRLRYRLDEYGLIPKILTATNPTKNFLYAEFYKPSKENTLQKYRRFIPALVQDNPFISKHYIENLKKLDRISKERLLFGNWEYDDDPSRLFDYEKILEIFTKGYKPLNREKRYMSVDVARFGNDSTIIIVWRDLFIYKIYEFTKQGTDTTVEKIKEICKTEGVPIHNVIIDEDGVGGGVVDNLKGCKGFVNNSKPRHTKNPMKNNYINIKAQCYFMIADKVNNGEIGCCELEIGLKKRLIEEFEQIKWKDPDKDGKIAVTPKEEIKEYLGRSPDVADAIMMRMYFETIVGMSYIAV
jgi:PBSX family phage terminase large subunit